MDDYPVCMELAHLGLVTNELVANELHRPKCAQNDTDTLILWHPQNSYTNTETDAYTYNVNTSTCTDTITTTDTYTEA